MVRCFSLLLGNNRVLVQRTQCTGLSTGYEWDIEVGCVDSGTLTYHSCLGEGGGAEVGTHINTHIGRNNSRPRNGRLDWAAVLLGSSLRHGSGLILVTSFHKNLTRQHKRGGCKTLCFKQNPTLCLALGRQHGEWGGGGFLPAILVVFTLQQRRSDGQQQHTKTVIVVTDSNNAVTLA